MNVSGMLVRGPVATCPPGEACDPQMTGAMLIFSRSGTADVSVFVSGDGTFALHLEPGAYTVRAAPPPLKGRLQPASVRVPATGSLQLHLEIVSAGS